VSRSSLERALVEDERLLVDASTLLAYLEPNEAVSPVATHVVDECVLTGRNRGIVSMVTAMEVLVRPLRVGVGGRYRHLLDFLTNHPNLTGFHVDLAVAQEAASLRATYGFATADALVIASGIVAQVRYLVTNDRQWKTKLAPIAGRIEVCYLADHLPFP
jgi:predicted nucleic acid-binding protein